MKKLGQKGVTIIEAMIVLAIIALIFSITFSVFQRYFGEKSFQHGVTLLQEEFNGFLNDVRQNTYPTREGIKCEDNYPPPPAPPPLPPNDYFLKFTSDPNLLIGQSDTCVFLGKAVQLGIGDTIDSEDERYVIHTLIGLREKNESNANIYMTFKDYDTSSPGHPIFDSTSIKAMPHGGLIKYAYFEDPILTPPNNKIYIDGFAVILDDFGAKTGGDQSIFLGGGRVIALKVIYEEATKTSATRPRSTVDEFAQKTYKQFVNPPLPPPISAPDFYRDFEGAITICLVSGKGRSAYIEIGSRSGFLKAVSVLEPQSDVNARCP